jgi:hypothetical protein
VKHDNHVGGSRSRRLHRTGRVGVALSLATIAIGAALPSWGANMSTMGANPIAGCESDNDVNLADGVPNSVMPGATESDTDIRAFKEQEGVLLTSSLAVDIAVTTTATVTYDENSDLSGGSIAALRKVDSHFLHADPVGSPLAENSVKFCGGISFDAEIIGIIVRDYTERNSYADTLGKSDFLGAIGTTYPGIMHPSSRGLEFNGAPVFDIVVTQNRHQLWVGMNAHLLDQIRVITKPLPANGEPRTPGFWGNKNGQATMNDGGTMAPELALLSSLNLVNGNGGAHNPTTYGQFQYWLKNGNAVNMAYMLSVHLAAMALNVEAGFVGDDELIYTPGFGTGSSTIGDVMNAANAALAIDSYTPTGDPNRATQEMLKDFLDLANNGLNFVL